MASEVKQQTGSWSSINVRQTWPNIVQSFCYSARKWGSLFTKFSLGNFATSAFINIQRKEWNICLKHSLLNATCQDNWAEFSLYWSYFYICFNLFAPNDIPTSLNCLSPGTIFWCISSHFQKGLDAVVRAHSGWSLTDKSKFLPGCFDMCAV